MEWMLVGERLNNGHSLYSGVWTEIGPLAAYIYGFVDLMFGRNQFYYELVAMVIVYAQALYFGYVINKNRVIIEKNYLPALMYVVIMSLSFDFNKLSPTLISISFLLLAINSLFKQIEGNHESSQHVFEAGLLIGLGSLCLYSFPVFLLWALISLVMFTPVKANQILLLVLGFLLPIFVSGIFFYFLGSFDHYYHQWLLQFQRLSFTFNKDLIRVFYVFGLPILIAVMGMIKIFGNVRYANFQNRKQQVLVFSAFFGLVAYLLSGNLSTYQALGLAPFLAFFLTGWFIHIRGIYTSELTFLGIIVLLVFINIQGVNPLFGEGYSHLGDLRIEKSSTKNYIRDRSILVTGEKLDDYFYAKSGSPYINWDVSKGDLEHPDIYQKLASVYANLVTEKPEYIIDNAQVFPKIFSRIPELNSSYERVEGTRHFRLKGL